MANRELTPREQAKQEGQKLLYDSVKHLTTLSTGSILLMIAVLEKFFTTPEWPILIPIGFVCFILSTVFSVITMIVLSNSVFYLLEEIELGSKKGALMFYCALGTFVLGMCSLVLFAIKNFR